MSILDAGAAALSDYPVAATLLFALSSLYLFRRSIASYLTPKPLPGIPYREGRQYPLIGDGYDIGKYNADSKGELVNWFNLAALDVVGKGAKYEGAGLYQVMFGFGGTTRQLVITDPWEAEDICVRRTAEFDRSDPSIHAMVSVIPYAQIVMRTDTMWKHHRRVMGPSMTSYNLAKFSPRASKAAADLVRLWDTKAKLLKPGEFFDTRHDLSGGLSDAIGAIAFGEAYGVTTSWTDQVRKMDRKGLSTDEHGAVVFHTANPAVYDSTQELMAAMPITSPFPRLQNFYDLHFNRRFLHNKKTVYSFLARRIKEGRALALERGNNRADLVDCVVDFCCLKEGGPDSLPEEEVMSELLVFLIAGEETSATTMSWWIKFMARNPEVQIKLRKELRDAGLDEDVHVPGDLSAEKYPYLEAVMYETLRLGCPTQITARQATRDVTVLGHVLPKNSVVLISNSLFQRWKVSDVALKPELASTRSPGSRAHFEKGKAGGQFKDWEEPDVFRPERWLDGDEAFDRDAGLCWPFGLGQRGCFGKNLAVVELKIFIATLNLAFFFEAIPAAHDNDLVSETFTRKTQQSYARPTRWSRL